jgi:hypothetical protein
MPPIEQQQSDEAAERIFQAQKMEAQAVRDKVNADVAQALSLFLESMKRWYLTPPLQELEKAIHRVNGAQKQIARGEGFKAAGAMRAAMKKKQLKDRNRQS